jgi:hypothetical protein
MAIRSFAYCACAVLCLPRLSSGQQQITVQQPVVRTFSVRTTVSVPDRGSAFLGSIGRSADSRSRFGPLRSGTSTGTLREHAGMNVGVWIHDFEEMDRMLLGRGAATKRPDDGPELTGYAAHSYRSLLARSPGREPGRIAVPAPRESSTSRADRFFRLGLAAENRGSPAVARLHFRTAARLGSSPARERLEQLDAATVAGR